MPDEVHQIGAILAVMDGEGGVEADLSGVVAQETGADPMEGAGPAESLDHDARIPGHGLAEDSLGATGHLRRRAARKCEKQNPPRVGAAHDQMRDAMRQRVGLPRPGAGDDEEGATSRAIGRAAMLDGSALLRIEFVEIGRGHRIVLP